LASSQTGRRHPKILMQRTLPYGLPKGRQTLTPEKSEKKQRTGSGPPPTPRVRQQGGGLSKGDSKKTGHGGKTKDLARTKDVAKKHGKRKSRRGRRGREKKKLGKKRGRKVRRHGKETTDLPSFLVKIKRGTISLQPLQRRTGAVKGGGSSPKNWKQTCDGTKQELIELVPKRGVDGVPGDD